MHRARKMNTRAHRGNKFLAHRARDAPWQLNSETHTILENFFTLNERFSRTDSKKREIAKRHLESIKFSYEAERNSRSVEIHLFREFDPGSG